MLLPNSKTVIIIIAAAVAIGPLSTDMYLPSLPGLTEVFDTSIDRIQVTLSVFLFGFAVAQLVYGPLADRYGRKPVMLGGMLLFVVASLGCTLATSVEDMILFRFLQALGACSGPVLGRTVIRDIHGPVHAAKYLSMMGSIMAIAPVLAPVLGGYLIVWFSWKSTFIFLLTFALITMYFIAFKVPETLAEDARTSLKPGAILSNFGTLLKHRVYMGYTLACTFIYSGLFAFLSGSSFVLQDYFGVPTQYIGMVYAIASVGFISGTLISQKIGPRLGIARTLQRGAIWGCLAASTMMVPALMDIHNIWITVFSQVLFMIAVGIVMPQAMAGALAPFPQMTGTASSLFGFIQSIISALVGLIVGHMHSGTPTTMAVTIAAMALLCLLSYQCFIAPGLKVEKVSEG